MPNDLTTAHVHIGRSRIETSLDQRGHQTVTTIKPTGSPPLEDRSKSSKTQDERPQRTARSSAEAVEFRREETSLHQLYRSTRETVETSRSAKIEELRRAVNNGSYQPNLLVVAERLLTSGELGGAREGR